MKEYYILLFVKILIAIIMAIVLGNGSVVWFNHMPVRWFDDDGLPEDIEQRQRIKSTPWKYIFISYFLATGIFLAIRESLQFEIGALIALFIITEMAISDIKYRIIPDQLNLLLAISSIGFVSIHERWYDTIIGAVVGFLLAIITYGLGRLLYKREVIGGADIKFYTAIGLALGYVGVIIIFMMTSLTMGVYDFYLNFTKQTEKSAEIPMLPFALFSVTIYMLFIWNKISLLGI